MGPGGLRGLQILRSGVQSARGGFDSHAFPPFLALVTAVILGINGPGLPAGHAAAAPGISIADSARVDSGASRRPAVADTASPSSATTPPRTAPRPPGLFDQPRWVMARSLAIPGWGQAHNRAWLKAGLVATAEGLLATRVVNDARDLERLDAEVSAARAAGDAAREESAVMAYNARLDRLAAGEWWLGAAVVYAVLDAYIDAHFRGFDLEFRNDPALPGGVAPKGARLGMRWSW